jgi:hypothetical protein
LRGLVEAALHAVVTAPVGVGFDVVAVHADRGRAEKACGPGAPRSRMGPLLYA